MGSASVEKARRGVQSSGKDRLEKVCSVLALSPFFAGAMTVRRPGGKGESRQQDKKNCCRFDRTHDSLLFCL